MIAYPHTRIAWTDEDDTIVDWLDAYILELCWPLILEWWEA
jgi:hypothetical protein